jgi:hypothetical protein
MKVREAIIVLVFIVALHGSLWADPDANDVVATAAEKRRQGLTFNRHYEPYDFNIEPNAPGYTLPLALNDIINLADIGRIMDPDSISNLLQQNGFAVVDPRSPVGTRLGYQRYLSDDPVTLYKFLNSHGIPLFITVDTMLHLYHVQFEYTLKDIEERHFVTDINDLTIVLLNDALEQYEQLRGDLNETARRNIAYLSVARKLIDPNASIPKLVADLVTSEVAKIEAHEGFKASDIFIYEEDYSQYVARGHYTRSEALKRYFRTMMWYGRMAFLLKGSEQWGRNQDALINTRDARIQTLQAVLLATSLKNVKVGNRTGIQVWDRLHKVMAFYAGLVDDLTPCDYLRAIGQVFAGNFVVSDLTNEDNLFALKKELVLLPSPRIYAGTGNVLVTGPVTPETLDKVLDKTKGMRLMGQRFVPDSYVLQRLVFPEVGSYLGDPKRRPFTAGSDGIGGFCRAYIRGLDLMALLGSREAWKILIHEGDTDYGHFGQRFGELKDEFDTLRSPDWTANLYWSWLHSLRPLLQELPKGYPEFMRTEAWQTRQLHAALASWVQLRHDTILLAKQTVAPTPGRAVSSQTSPPPPPGYIEPVPVFWGRLLSLTRMTSQGLDELNVLSPEARQRLNRLEDLLRRILQILAKQLTNERLSPEDREFINRLPIRLDSIVTGGQLTPRKATLVADMHTYSLEAKVVEEAVDGVDLIVVACPMPDGNAFLAAGPVLSYYEFKHPMADRLTDETWRELLDSPYKPERPKWYATVLRDGDNSYANADRTELKTLKRLTNNSAFDLSPSWSPDGKKIAFDSLRDGNYEIYVMNVDGSGIKRLTNSPAHDGVPSWSPDGKKIAFSSDRDGNDEIYVMNADGSDQKRLTNNPAVDGCPSWSPDGKKLAFVLLRDDNPEIYIMDGGM